MISTLNKQLKKCFTSWSKLLSRIYLFVNCTLELRCKIR